LVMLSRCLRSLLIFACSVSLMRADFTMGYEIIVEVPAAVKAAVAEQLQKSVQAQLPPFLTIQVKDDRGFWGTSKFKTVVDYSTKQVTVIDSVGKRFATIPMDRYPAAANAAMPEPTAAAQAGAAKANFTTRKTGRTQIVLGLPTEEYEATLSLPAPVALAGRYSSQVAKTVMRLWMAKPEDLLHIGVSYSMDKMSWFIIHMNPAVYLQKAVGRYPSYGDEFASYITQLSKDGALVMQAELDVYAPTLNMVGRELAGESPVLPPDTLVLQVSEEIQGLAFDLLENAAFNVPVDYDEVDVKELLRPYTP